MDHLPSPADLYEDAPCGLLVTDRDGTIQRVNRTMGSWTGYRPDELIGRTVQSLMTMGARIFHQTHWAPLLQLQGSVSEVKLDIIHRDGQVKPVMVNAIRRTENGFVRHELAMFMAQERHLYERELVASRKRAEQILQKEREAQAALAATEEALNLERDRARDRAAFAEQLIGIVSHDLRNPLAAIAMSTALIGSDPLTSRQKRSLQTIGSAAGRATHLIADLLDYTRTRLGTGVSAVLAECDLHQLVAGGLDELRTVFPLHALIHQRTGAGSGMFDAHRIVQLLGNLVSNAATHGAPSAPITITSRTDAVESGLSVHNMGPAIPMAQRPQLFEAMTRGASVSDRATHSVGLGLLIAREIVRAHGGTMTVSSTTDTGTTFSATFPQERRPLG